MTLARRLPVVLPPEADERLSSWLARTASFYAMTLPEFLTELGLAGRGVFDLERRLAIGEGARIADRTRLSPEALQAMTFGDMIPEARRMISRRNRHRCPECPPEVRRKSTALPWTFRCPAHGRDLCDDSGSTLLATLGAEPMSALAPCAETGAVFLDRWASGSEPRSPSLVDLLALMTLQHRGLLARSRTKAMRRSGLCGKAYRAPPIIQQAVAVVVPEYAQVAGARTQPIRTGLRGLAQASLLQAFALTAGIGRLLEMPHDRVADIFRASDVEGQERLADALRSRPLALIGHEAPHA